MDTDTKNSNILPCLRSVLCYDNRCPFGHDKPRICIKSDPVVEEKYIIGHDYITPMIDDVLEHTISFLENRRNITRVSKRFVELGQNIYHINALPQRIRFPFVADLTTNETQQILSFGKNMYIYIDPHYAANIIRDLSLYKRMSKYIHGLGIFYNRNTGFKRRGVHNYIVRLAIDNLTDLKFLWYNNMAIDYHLCRHNRGLEELKITNCVFVDRCHIIDPNHKLQRLTLKNTIIHDEVVFPSTLESLKLHVFYTKENLKSICKCNLLFLDIGFTRFICSFMELLPMTLRVIDIRTNAKTSLYAKKTLNNCNALVNLCTGYLINGEIVEAKGIKKHAIYHKYMRGNTVVILHLFT